MIPFECRSGCVFRKAAKQHRGFSTIELLTAATILIVLFAFAVPNVLTMVHSSRLRGATSDFSGIVQIGRIRAVQDDRFYSVYTLGSESFVDIYPQSNTGASGSGGTTINNQDPVIGISPEVTEVAASSAPATANLKGQFLPTGSTLSVNDGSPAGGSPITFGPRGLPCTPQTTTGGTVCDSAGGATAFWVFFQDIVTQQYRAVTVSPSGRIRAWFYGSGAWHGM
jgi:Tfp pilus assembly protein FimT